MAALTRCHAASGKNPRGRYLLPRRLLVRVKEKPAPEKTWGNSRSDREARTAFLLGKEGEWENWEDWEYMGGLGMMGKGGGMGFGGLEKLL